VRRGIVKTENRASKICHFGMSESADWKFSDAR
jgi:hypothetical protein